MIFNGSESIGANCDRCSFVYDARGNLISETRPGGITINTAYDGYGRLTGYARSGEASLTHVYNGLDDRVATTTTLAGGGSDTRRFIYAPDGRVLGEYGASAADIRAEFIWMSPEVGDAGQFGGDDGLGGYMPLAVSTPDPIAGAGASQLSWVQILRRSSSPASPASAPQAGWLRFTKILWIMSATPIFMRYAAEMVRFIKSDKARRG